MHRNDRASKTICIPVIVMVALVVTVAIASPSCGEAINKESILDQARIMVDAGQSESAREILKPYIASGGPRMDYAEYLMMLTAFSDPDPDAPRRAVENFRRRYPASTFSGAALQRLGQFYRSSLRNPDMAVAAYSQLLKEHPKSPAARAAYLWLASALIDAGQYDRAIATIHQALALYEYGPQERSMLEGLRDFAKQSTGRAPSSGVTIDVKPAAGKKEPELPPEIPKQKPEPSSPPAVPASVSPSVRPVETQTRSKTAEANADASVENPAGQPTVQMNYRDAEIDDVLNVLATELGLTFIKDADVRGKVTIINPRPMTQAEALSLFESILEMKGFAMVRSGHVYKILQAQKSYSKGIETYMSDQITPTSDRPITKVLRLHHAMAADAASVLQPLMGDGGSVYADAGKNTLVMTSSGSNIARLENVARAIDGAGTGDRHQPFQLRFLSAAEALPLAQTLLSTSQSDRIGSLKLVAGPTPSYLFAVGPVDMVERLREVLKLIDVPGYKEESLKVYALQVANAEKLASFLETLLAKGLAGSYGDGPTRPGVITADRMTNSIVVLGSKAFHDVISPLVGRLDYEGFAAFRVQISPLQYANAVDLAGKFENIVARGLGIRGEAYGNQVLIQADVRLNALIIASNSQSLLKTLMSLAEGLDRPSEEGGPRTIVYYLENATATELVTVLSSVFTQGDAAANSAKIVADKGTNSLVISAARDKYDVVMETVMKLDIAPYQVLVEAIILEVSLDASDNLGVDWTLNHANVDFGIRPSSGGATVEPLDFMGIKQAVVKNNNQLNGVIQALTSRTNTRVLATPRIFAANNQEASILIGDQVPIKTGSSTTTGGVTQNTFDYKDVGIKLTVTPHINRKRQTVLDIDQEIKSIRSTRYTGVTDENPVIQTRQTKTNAVLNDGQTVILGGLIRTDREKIQNKVPVLGSIPILGNAFRSTSESDVRTELLIFLTPSVIVSDTEMSGMVKAQKKSAEKVGLGKVRTDPDTERVNFIRDFILK